jgi:hypothetical protein
MKRADVPYVCIEPYGVQARTTTTAESSTPAMATR